MTVDELRKTIKTYRLVLKERSGTMCVHSESGPVGMVVIEALLIVLEQHELRITAMEMAERPDGGNALARS